MAIYPLSAASHSAAGFHRRLGGPRFTPREEAIVDAVFQHVDWLHPADVSPAGRTAITLSPRERQVMLFLLEGNSRKEMAAKMGLSPHTLTDYLKEIYRKFGVRSRAELLAKFIRSEVKLRLSRPYFSFGRNAALTIPVEAMLRLRSLAAIVGRLPSRSS
jgi:DNA-binding CsgD family transcriptional regulator